MANDIEKAFAALSLEEMSATLARLTNIRHEAVATKRAELMAQLKALEDGPAVPNKPAAGARAPAVVKYRSLKNPNLTWSGRGQKAAWLTAEMAETGKDIEAFRV